MPQIAIEYSSNLADLFDRRALAGAVHRLVTETIDTDLGNCKTRLIALDDVLIGAGGGNEAMLHVDLRILSGRAGAAKEKLGRAVLAAAEQALERARGLSVQITVEVRDLDRDHYHKKRI